MLRELRASVVKIADEASRKEGMPQDQRGSDKRSLLATTCGLGAGPAAPGSLLQIEVGGMSDRFPAGN